MTDPTTTARPLTLPRRRVVSPYVIIAALVALVFIGAGALVASEFAPPGRDASIVTAFVLGTIAPTAVGLLALIRGDHAAQIGASNAERLVDTAHQVELVARDVNGHLERHEDLAAKVTNVAEAVAAAAGVPITSRDPELRTRTTDPTPDTPPDAAPLDPEQV